MNKYKKFIISLITVLGLFYLACSVPIENKTSPSENSNSSITQPIDYVNPYMGNISHLLVPTFPTIHLPNSIMRVYPERRDFTADLLNGLPLIVTSHRGSSAFNLSPYQGAESGIKPVINYSYDNEKLTPYSYAAYLDEQQTTVNFALSSQSAMYEINFEKEEDVFIIINSRNGAMNWNGSAASGYQNIENDTKVYLYMMPEELSESVFVLKEGHLTEATNATGKNACMVLKYPKGTKKLSMSVMEFLLSMKIMLKKI